MASTLRFVFLAVLFCGAPRVEAAPYFNGWTEHLAQEYVRGCVSSYGEKQMRSLLRRGQIKPDATAAQIEEVQALVTSYVTATCTCAQDRVMHDSTLDEFNRKGRQPAYMTEVMTACSQQVLEAGQAPGVSAAPSTSAAVASEGPTSSGDAGYKLGVLVGFLVPILAILAVVVWLLWLVFRPKKAPREGRRSGW